MYTLLKQILIKLHAENIRISHTFAPNKPERQEKSKTRAECVCARIKISEISILCFLFTFSFQKCTTLFIEPYLDWNACFRGVKFIVYLFRRMHINSSHLSEPELMKYISASRFYLYLLSWHVILIWMLLVAEVNITNSHAPPRYWL